MDIYRQSKLFNVNISNLYSNKYLVYNDSKKNLIYVELPEIEEFYGKYSRYNEIKEDLKYYMYHKYNKSSEVVVKNLPIYGALKQNSYEANFVSSYHKKNEVIQEKFPFYTSIDSIKVNLAYNHPIAIDTIRLKINKPNKYGIQFEKHLDYGLIIKYPFKKDFSIIEAVGVDKEGKTVLASEIQKYYTHEASEEANVLKYRKLISNLYSDIYKNTITNTEDLWNKMDEYKQVMNFNPNNSTFKFRVNNLYQIHGEAKEVILYVSNEVRYVSENYVIKKNNTHPLFDEVEFEENNYIYNIKDNKLYKADKYQYITYLENNIFEVTKPGNLGECERIVLDQKGNKKKIGTCNNGNFLILPNGCLKVIEKSSSDFNESVKIYDKVGNLSYEGINTIVVSEYKIDSNFLIQPVSQQKAQIIFADFSQTEELENYHVYSKDRVLFKRNDLYGVLDDFGKLIIPFEYDSMEAIDNKTLLVSKNQKQFIINDKNEILYTAETNKKLSGLLSYRKKYMFDFSYLGIVQMERDGLKGLIDKTGKVIYPLKADEIFEVGFNRIALINEQGKLGVIDNKGKVIIPFVYDKINSYYKDYAILIEEDSKKFTFYDYEGNVKAKHQALEFYTIFEAINNPSLILDDEVIIRYDGKVTK